MLLPLIYFLPVLIGHVALVPGDGWSQNIGVRVLVGRMIAQGQWPLWNPYVYAGMPLLASVDPGALYPPNWLFVFLPPAVAMNILVITSFHLALIGTYLFARRVGLSRVGALVSGMIFTFGAFPIIHLAHTHRITALVWLPWVMLAIEHLARSESWRARWRWVSFGAIFIALQLFAGDPQMTAYTVMLGGAYGLFLLMRCPDRTQRWRLLAAASMMAVCGLLLSAAQLLPERELLAQGGRAGLTYEQFSSYSLPPRQLLELIFPYFFGGAFRLPFRAPYWGAWNAAVPSGYVGLLGLMLALAAFSLSGKNALTRFWLVVAVVTVILCFGGYLPFGLNHLLHHLPVYNLFRGSYRHFYEFTFAAGMLAGMGADLIARSERAQARRAVMVSVTTLAALVILTAILYRFFGAQLAMSTPHPAGVGALSDAEAWVPLSVFVIAAITLWLYVRRNKLSIFHLPSSIFDTVLLAVLLLDLASCGWFFQWRSIPNQVAERLADPPTVRFIKEHETDLASFRVISHFAFPYDGQYFPVWERMYDLLNWPDVSSARGLQCVSGADPFRLLRLTAIAGDMEADGLVPDRAVFGEAHRGLDLLNTKYLLLEHRPLLERWQGITHDGIIFGQTPFGIEFKSGVQLTTWLEDRAATELAIISMMSNSVPLPDGAPVLRIKLHTTDGRVIERELQAGRDTSEWAYDRPDVRAEIKHQRAPVAESYGAEGFQAHLYLARLSFDRATIDRIEWEYAQANAAVIVQRATLYDAETKMSSPLSTLSLPPERWRKLASIEQVDIYENLKRMPRAWFVRRLEARPSAEVLKIIKQGRFSETTLFDPAETALLETEDFGGHSITLPPVSETSNGQVKVTRYEPQRIELETHNAQPGFLMLSEVYYRGWEARIDGQKTPVYRADYALRGIAVPPGDHRIEFAFHSPSFRQGVFCLAIGVMLLLVGAVVIRIRSNHQKQPAASVIS